MASPVRPVRRIPVLIDDRVALPDSSVICRRQKRAAA
jgi:glutathione S-transferase